MTGKIIIIAAPSGCGKSTIINALLEGGDLNLGFAVSATTRPPREGERDGVNYYFMTEEQFRDHITEGDFVEFEEVYPGRFYGTLRSEVERITSAGHNIILDLDVNGALGVKQLYGDRAMTVFIAPPSLDELRRRLEFRGTESAEVIDVRRPCGLRDVACGRVRQMRGQRPPRPGRDPDPQPHRGICPIRPWRRRQ